MIVSGWKYREKRDRWIGLEIRRVRAEEDKFRRFAQGGKGDL